MQLWTSNLDVTGGERAPCATQQPNKRVPRGHPAHFGTGMTTFALAVDFPSRNAGQPNSWPLGAPDGTVTIPHRYGRAGEGNAYCNDLCNHLSGFSGATVNSI